MLPRCCSFCYDFNDIDWKMQDCYELARFLEWQHIPTIIFALTTQIIYISLVGQQIREIDNQKMKLFIMRYTAQICKHNK